jgi:hypothetical protein
MKKIAKKKDQEMYNDFAVAKGKDLDNDLCFKMSGDETSPLVEKIVNN